MLTLKDALMETLYLLLLPSHHVSRFGGMTLLLTATLAHTAAALEYFHPSCTLPSQDAAYVSSPSVRSTLDIVWTALATIFACTYTVLHLNVPAQDRKHVKIDWASIWTSVKWTIAAILAPELLLVKAIHDWHLAKRTLREIHQTVKWTVKKCTLTHMLFAGMGGFVVEYSGSSPPPAETMQVTGTEEEERLITQQLSGHQPSILEGVNRLSNVRLQSPGIVVPGRNRSMGMNLEDDAAAEAEGNITELTTFVPERRITAASAGEGRTTNTRTDNGSTTATRKLIHLTLESFENQLRNGNITERMLVSEAEISDKSKETMFTKGLASLQAFAYVLGVLVRVSGRLTVTPLEVGVCAFVACSVFIYGLSLRKPKSVDRAIILAKGIDDSDLESWYDRRCKREENGKRYYESVYFWDSHFELGGPVPNDFMDNEAWWMLSWYPLVTVAFGAIHLAGWNLTFVSSVDSWLWRGAALATTSVTLTFLIILLCGQRYAINSQVLVMGGTVRTDRIVELAVLLYAIARLILIVEMFRSLFYLPPEAFVTTWTANIPHIG